MESKDSLLLNITTAETRVAWVKTGSVQEFWIERANKKNLVGNVYYAKVQRVLPGMQTAFIDIGLEKSGFLHIADIFSKSSKNKDDIAKLLRPGQEIVVQVLKNERGNKGVRLTMFIAIPANLLVFLPVEKTRGVSQKISTKMERERLREAVKTILKAECSDRGYIVRTSAEGAEYRQLQLEVQFLEKQWEEVQVKIKLSQKPSLVYERLPLFLQVLIESALDQLVEIKVDCLDSFKRMQKFSAVYGVGIADKLQYYSNEKHIFDLYNVEVDLQNALKRRVNLESGGYLVFDNTEAMTTIDINTGSFVGHKNLEQTVFRTNLEAVKMVAKQLRLRNLGGIIILDLIDMQEDKHKQMVSQLLKKELVKDSMPTSSSDISSLGLIEMTRKRTRDSLDEAMCTDCPTCNAKGRVKMAETIIFEIFRELSKMVKQFEASNYKVIASESVVSYVADNATHEVVELENFLNKKISFQAEVGYLPEQFDVVIL